MRWKEERLARNPKNHGVFGICEGLKIKARTGSTCFFPLSVREGRGDHTFDGRRFWRSAWSDAWFDRISASGATSTWIFFADFVFLVSFFVFSHFHRDGCVLSVFCCWVLACLGFMVVSVVSSSVLYILVMTSWGVLAPSWCRCVCVCHHFHVILLRNVLGSHDCVCGRGRRCMFLVLFFFVRPSWFECCVPIMVSIRLSP